jgi:5-methylcytosine-specific restriction endonuclease McrA
MKLWRKSVFTRDNFTCQKCYLKGIYLIAHHINNFVDFIELRLAIDNGITFCKKCHLEFHKKYGFKNNTKGQLEEFLSIK